MWLLIFLSSLLGFVVLFVSIWCFVCWLISTISGWNRIADAFPDRSQERLHRKTISGYVGIARYKNCLLISCSEEGFHLSVWPIFRLAHPPMFVPWNAIHDAQIKKDFFRHNVWMQIGMPVVGTMQLPSAILEGQPIQVLGESFAKNR